MIRFKFGSLGINLRNYPWIHFRILKHVENDSVDMFENIPTYVTTVQIYAVHVLVKSVRTDNENSGRLEIAIDKIKLVTMMDSLYSPSL